MRRVATSLAVGLVSLLALLTAGSLSPLPVASADSLDASFAGGAVYQASCPSPRPPVKLSVTPAGEGQLKVTVTAGAGFLHTIRFGALQNARLIFPGDAQVQGGGSLQTGNFNLTPANGLTSFTFTVATTGGQAVTVPMTVVDDCGDWPTFVGGGVQALQANISIADAQVTEGNSGTTPMTFTVKLSEPSTGTISVDYATADGTAKTPDDYNATQGTLTFSPGTTQQTITVQVKGDLLAEGDETFSVNLSNAKGGVITDGSATGTIKDDDSKPAAKDDSYAASVGTTLTVNAAQGVLANDSPGGGTAQVASFGGGSAGGSVTSNAAGSTASLGNGGSLKVNADGSLTFVPPTTFTGGFTFQYRLTSPAGTADATVTIDVRKPPTAVDDPNFSVNGSGPLNVAAGSGLLQNDTLGVPAAQISSFGGNDAGGSVTSNAAGATLNLGNGGSLKVNADGSFSFTAPGTFSGPFKFQYRLTNSAGSSDATVTIDVKRGAGAVDDTYTTTLPSGLTVPAPGLLGNDTLGLPAATVVSFGGGSLGGTVDDHPAGGASVPLAGGTLTVNTDGSFSLNAPTTPGDYTFRYKIQNPAGSDSALVTLHVQQVPTANDDAGAAFAVQPGTTLTQPAGTLFANNGSGADVLGFPAATIVKYGGGSLGGTVDDISAGTTVTLPPDGSLVVNADGGFSFKPATGFTGAFTFQYRLSNTAGTDTATVTIQVQSSPVAQPDTFTVIIGGANLSGDVTAANPTTPDSLGVPAATVTSYGGPATGVADTVTSHAAGTSTTVAGGSFSIASNGAITLTGATTPGDYTLQYRLTNISGTSDGTVTIHVQQAPVANDDAGFTVQPGTTLTKPAGTLFADNGSGADVLGTPAATIVKFGGGTLGGSVDDNNAGATATFGTGGSLTVGADGSFSFTPASGFTGAFTFQYRLSNAAGTDTATVTIQVQAPPVAQPDTFTITIGGPNLTGNVTAANPTTPDDLGVPAATVTSYGGPATGGADTVTSHAAGTNTTVAGGTFSIASNGAITLNGATTPGDYTLQYRLTNVAGTSDGTVTIHVQQAPDAKDDAGFTAQPGNTLTGPAGKLFADNGSGADVLGFPAATIVKFGGGTLGGTVDDNNAGATATFGTGGSLTVGTDGSFSFTPASGFTGAFTFQYRLSNAAGTDTATVTIQVQRPPTAAADAFTITVGGAALSGNVTAANPTTADDLGVPAATVTSYGGPATGGGDTVTSHAAGSNTTVAGGTFSIASNGAISLTGATTGGVYTLSYRLTNVAGTSDATVTITVNQAPVANDDAPKANSVPGDVYHVAFNAPSATLAQNLFNNNPDTGTGADTRGFPAATISSFGSIKLNGTLIAGGDTVTSHAAGSAVTLGTSGSLQVNADGTVTFKPDTGFTGLVTFQYRLTNAAGSDDANVTLEVGARPTAGTLNNVAVTGNVKIDTSTGTPQAVPFGGDGVTLALTSATSPKGSDVTLNTSTGTFTVDPKAGLTGTDSFTYTVTNGFGPVTGTVNLTISGMIWFVDDSAAAGGDGRLTHPFQSLSSLQGGTDPDVAGDVIFLFSGTYTTGLPLEDNQWFIGQAASLSQALTDKGVTLAPHSITLPSTGTAPSINTSSGDGLTLANGNTVRGVNFGPSGGNAINASGKSGATVSGVTITATNAANGVQLATQAGTVSFDNLDVTTATGTAFSMSGSSTPTLTVTNGSTINAVSGQGLILSALNVGAANVTFGTLTSGGGTNNVSLTNVGGTGSLSLGASGNTLTNASGASFNVSGGATNVTYNGNITSGTGRSVSVVNRSGGTVAFTGSVTDNDTGILLDNNDQSGGNGVVTFSGGVTASTGTNAAFTATNGGTVNVTGSSNTLTTTTGTALTVTSTTIGANNLNFRTISSNGAANGILLSSTGTSGGLVVTGDGSTAGSGGTIQNSTASGINANDTVNLSLAWMNLTNNGNAANEDNLTATYVSGTVLISHVAFTPSNTTDHNALFDVPTPVVVGTRTLNLTIDNSTFNHPPGASTIAEDSLLVQGRGSWTMNTTISNSQFLGARGDQFQLNLLENSTSTLNVHNNTFDNSAYLANTASFGGGITIGGGGGTSTPHLTYTIDTNVVKFAKNIQLAVIINGGTADYTGTISNNQFGTAAEAGSGTFQGLAFTLNGNGASKAYILNNSVHHYQDAGMYFTVNRGSPSYSGIAAKFEVFGNTIATPDAPSINGVGTAGLFADIGLDAPDTTTACIDLGSTLVPANKNTMNGSKPTPNGSADVALLQDASTVGHIDLPQYTVTADNGTAVPGYIQGRNNNGSSTTVIGAGAYASGFRQVAAGACH